MNEQFDLAGKDWEMKVKEVSAMFWTCRFVESSTVLENGRPWS